MGRQRFPFLGFSLQFGWLIAVGLFLVLAVIANPQIGSGADTAAPVAEEAAVAPVLAYQGRLLDPVSGAPKPDGIYTMIFRIYNVESGGSPQWSETKDIPVSNGLFNTLLGDTTALPAALFNGQNLWLGIKVSTDPEAAPRQRLAPVAYALYADNVDRLDGQHGAFYRNAGNMNAGTLADERVAATLTRDNEVMGIVTAADGAGSGLDADLLDGQHGAFYRDAGNINAGILADERVAATLTRDNEVMGIVSGNDGAGSGLDADLLDGQQGTFYRNASNINAGTLADERVAATLTRDNEVMGIVTAADGTGSGLDADLLDGQDSAAFAAASHSHDNRYFTESESDGRFVNATGDTMTGNGAGAVLSVTQIGTGASGYFSATTSYGVQGETASSATGIAGVNGRAGLPGTTINGKYGVLGQSDTGRGVTGVSRDSNGLYGWSTETYGIRGEGENGGVYALSFGSGSRAIYGQNTSTSGASYGVYGESSSTDNGAGVRGQSAYVGVWGESSGRWGLYGRSTGTSNSYGVYGVVTSGTGNYAGYFAGNVNVTGSLSKGSGSFKIDHPLDPENKYLYHSFVESPDMMNVYNGNVVLDDSGAAWVQLPDYFEALNRDYRYQLTPIGGPGPNLYIAQEVQNNQFQIAGGAPGLRVSWQVTGIRQDPYANANRIAVEVMKPEGERGTYLYPEAYGQETSRGLDFQRNQEVLGMPDPGTVPGIEKGSTMSIDPTLGQPQIAGDQ